MVGCDYHSAAQLPVVRSNEVLLWKVTAAAAAYKEPYGGHIYAPEVSHDGDIKRKSFKHIKVSDLLVISLSSPTIHKQTC